MARANVSLARCGRVAVVGRCLVVHVVIVLSAIACSRPAPPMELVGRELDVAAPSTSGRFLEARAALSSPSSVPLEALRPTSRTDFAPRYERIALRSGERLVDATLQAGDVRAGTTFTFPCPTTAATLRFGLYARTAVPGRLRLRVDGREVVLAAPDAERLLFFDAPVDPGRCRTTSEVAVSALPEGDVLITEPRLLVTTSALLPSIILISVDTLRADVWDEVATATEGLASFRAAAVRYTRAFSSYPSTPLSHSVMLSGMAPTDVSSRPVDDALSFVPALRAAGYATLGFVAGGFVRSEFGFGNRAPGFALGFDLYLESYGRTRAERDVVRSLDAELPTTYTLGAALERSLRWFASYPSSPAFQFVHGYDVHEYRTVDRAYYDRAARAVDAEALQRCVAASGVNFDAEEVVHYPFQRRSERRLDAPIECQRLLFGVFYRARAFAAADTLARYFAALRELGVYDRALIVLTSDHGESLRDERGRDGELAWGHNRILANNLSVPLWVKFPVAGTGAAVDAVAGVIGIRRLVEAVVANPRARPSLETGRTIPVASNKEGAGIVLPDGTICALNDPTLRQPWLTLAGEWIPVDEACTGGPGAGTARCAVQRACAAAAADLQEADAPHMPRIPSDLEAELRALGYVDP